MPIQEVTFYQVVCDKCGYRQPSHLCPDCLAKLRAVLGVEIDRKEKCACNAARFCYDLGSPGCVLHRG